MDTVSVAQINAPKKGSASEKKKTMMNERAKSPIADAKAKLPYCPEGATTTVTNQGPCRKKPPKARKQKAFRVPLKKEDGNMEAQIIEYNAEFPNRVVVRLEYLMQSTKVRLNDREWMAEFYTKLTEEENRAMKKSMREREKGEMSRMKQLIIEGIDKVIPDELSYLHSHPVFRVNQMLSRLSAFDDGMTAAEVGENDYITPVEPFEYDGNRFFRHLHQYGSMWVPEEQEKFDREKLMGKIYRAKLRLKQSREAKANEEKVLRLLNNPDHPDAISLIHADDLELSEGIIRGGDDTIDHSIGGLIDRLKTKSNMTLNRINEKIRQSKHKEKTKGDWLQRMRTENETKFVRSADTFRLSHMYDSSSDESVDPVNELLKNNREETAGPDDRIMTIRLRMHDHEEHEKQKKEGRRSHRKKDSEEPTTNFEGTLFEKLVHVYRVPEEFPYSEYEPYENELMDKVEDNSDFDDIAEAAEEVSLMYDRQKLVLEDYLRKQAKSKK